ncbi:MAG: hypothetical protein GTO45_19305 [Candidatus Aminicenantes bacterium]|nr:hypothetical protein [Candidatus Aminicenantes bacterium]NIO83179.1 hypothetical protein [Candidatus Aminicenantes bacterium]NIR07776.1 hypothetical protein [Candidatus Aminicenantes bacterium]
MMKRTEAGDSFFYSGKLPNHKETSFTFTFLVTKVDISLRHWRRSAGEQEREYSVGSRQSAGGRGQGGREEEMKITNPKLQTKKEPFGHVFNAFGEV